MSPERAWRVRDATLADREAALALAARAFRSSDVDPLAERRWNWLFAENPANVGMRYVVADAGDRLAGQYALLPVRMQHEGAPVLGLVSLHTATDPAFERQGVFTALASALYAKTRDEAPIVYGFPNTSSAPGFFRKLGWVAVEPYPLLLRPLAGAARAAATYDSRLAPLSPAAAVGGRLLELADRTLARAYTRGDARIVELDDFGPWVDALWQRLSPALGTAIVRDAAFLRWRFSEAPFRYRKLAFERHGKIVGFIVSGLVPWRTSSLAYLMELMVDPEEPGAAHALVARALADAARDRAAAFYALATPRHPHWRALLASGLVRAPRALSKKHAFGVRANGPACVPNALFHVRDWYVSGADLDYV